MRLDDLARRLEQLKAQLAGGLETEAINRLLPWADVLHRHGDLSFAARRVRTAAIRRRRAVLEESAADFCGIEASVRAWIARLDAAARR